MDNLLLYIFILLSTFTIQGQNRDGKSFSQVVEMNIREYSKKSEIAYLFQDFDRADFLFDSIIDNVVKGSYLDNFEVHKRSGKKTELYRFKKPIILITYSTWCTPGKGEIPALNKIVQKYYKEIDFVILFWDSKQDVRKATRKYSSKINVIYVDERDNKSDYVVKIMKHSFGFPTTFFLDKNKTIVDLRRSVIDHYYDEFDTSFNSNYNSFLDGVSILKELLESERIALDKTSSSEKI